jgi:hypothetical protein
MSSPDYKALYEEQCQRADRAVQRAEDERQRAEDERQRAEDERQRAEELRRRNQKTTLTEYLDLLHTHISQRISVQTDKAMTTQGDPITKPDGKLRPNQLLQWTDYLDLQREIFERLLNVYPVERMERVFQSETFVTELGDTVALRKLASELDLHISQRETVETPISHIIRHLCVIEDVRQEFALTGDIMFDNHPNSLSDAAEEVALKLQQLQLEPSTPQYPAASRGGLKADQICVYTTPIEGGVLRKLALVVEYKAPHKLTVEALRFGFHAMDLKNVINRSTIPTEKAGLFQYHADRVVATVVTQAFNYMIEGRTQFGYITTGEVFVFLYVSLDDLGTVYYHVAEPNADVKAQLNDSLPIQAFFIVLLLARFWPSFSSRWRQPPKLLGGAILRRMRFNIGK